MLEKVIDHYADGSGGGKKNKFNSKKLTIFIIAALVVVIVAVSSVTVVKSGYVGILSMMGEIQDEVFEPGLNFKIPFLTSVIHADVKTQKVDVAAAAASKDLQTVDSIIVLNYHINPSSAVTLYRNVGRNYVDTIIVPVTQETLKAVAARYSAEELITQRSNVAFEIKSVLTEKLVPYGLAVDEFNITNLDFSTEFNAAIEAKQTAQQQALKAQQDLLRIEVEAQQKIAQAKGEAEAIAIIQEQLASSPRYIEYQKINKWNGVLPQVQGDSGVIIDMREQN